MRRLIDADLLMEKLNVFNDREHGNEHFLYGIETAKELLEDVPTAYDVEKVVEQIKILSPANYVTKDDVLKIVKGGEVNE